MPPGEKAVASLGLHFPNFYLGDHLTDLDFEEVSAWGPAGPRVGVSGLQGGPTEKADYRRLRSRFRGAGGRSP